MQSVHIHIVTVPGYKRWNVLQKKKQLESSCTTGEWIQKQLQHFCFICQGHESPTASSAVFLSHSLRCFTTLNFFSSRFLALSSRVAAMLAAVECSRARHTVLLIFYYRKKVFYILWKILHFRIFSYRCRQSVQLEIQVSPSTSISSLSEELLLSDDGEGDASPRSTVSSISDLNEHITTGECRCSKWMHSMR